MPGGGFSTGGMGRGPGGLGSTMGTGGGPMGGRGVNTGGRTMGTYVGAEYLGAPPGGIIGAVGWPGTGPGDGMYPEGGGAYGLGGCCCC